MGQKIKRLVMSIPKLVGVLLVVGTLIIPRVVWGAEEMARDYYYRGQVVRVAENEQSEELSEALLTQTVIVKIVSGTEKNQEVTVEYQIRGDNPAEKQLAVGDRVVINKNVLPDNTTHYYVTEPFRLPILAGLGFLFFVLTIIIAGRRGFFAFLGLASTLLIIAFYIIPQISQGASPFIVSLIGAALIASISLALGHGFHKNTALALVSIVITIALALGLSMIFVSAARLFGLGSEEAYYLQFGLEHTINLRGLLLGGIIIGVLGVLDDVTTAQVAAVSELHAASEKISAKELYVRAMRIGREHIVAVVNTLVLAYVGAAFPLVLMFQTFTTPWWVTLNTELISEEVLRTLIGSIALVAAVPITTLLAVWFYHRRSS